MPAAPISHGELLTDKVAFVTGAAQGIGLAVARAYVSQGASVVLADIAREPMERAITAFSDSSKAMAVAFDVTNEEQTASALRKTLPCSGYGAGARTARTPRPSSA